DGRKGTIAVCNAPGALSWSNYIAQVKIRTPDENAIGVLFRYRDTNNYYKLELDQRADFRKLLVITNGVEITLAREPGGYMNNTDLVVRVEAFGDKIYATLNGTPLFGGIVTNASLPTGSIGLYCWKSAGVTFDDVDVAPS